MVLVAAASVQDRDAAKPLLRGLTVACHRIWRWLPPRVQRALPAIGLIVCLVGYLVMPVGLRDQTQASDPAMWVGLLAWGVGMGAALSPLMTKALLTFLWPRLLTLAD